ncbi:hypothetical protein CKO31_22240 [Thiohalocapsa halophila]|uniref:PEP-CTERM sorting domain-containing protein n=1 Tax=Thiohalocapsa halophila TaxID=69359 RepID=A0ABS1CNJ7_9GAMM|nr:hypothetical protein [Thiohalocapsa halophila]MBK1633417.1 hypothetical protein [Thiohalocapsa halophila]
MQNLKTIALSGAVTAALAMSLPAASAIVDGNPGTVGNFCSVGTDGTNPDTFRFSATSRYQYTCYIGSAGQTLDPAAGHMALTDLADDTAVNIQEFVFAGEVTGTLQVTSFETGVETGTISYFVELAPAPGFEPDDQPDIRFADVTITQETLQQNDDNTASRKQITGQNNVVISDAAFTADLNASGQGGTDSATCGVCRKFAVTDSFDNNVSGVGGDAGRIQSLTNTYVTVVPAPAPLALLAAGLMGIGIFQRRRKAA